MPDARGADDASPGDVVSVVRRIAAPRDIVFGYLVDPGRFVQWMGVGADLDARPGGAYQVTVGPNTVAAGRYEVIDPPNRLVFSWGWRGDPEVPTGSTTVEILLTQDGDGTLLELRHSGLPGVQSRASHTDGWNLYLGQLTTLLGS